MKKIVRQKLKKVKSPATKRRGIRSNSRSSHAGEGRRGRIYAPARLQAKAARLVGVVKAPEGRMILEISQPRVIPVSLGDHQPSPHVLSLRRVKPVSAPAVQPIDYAVGQSSLFYWLNELSAFSFFSFLFLVGVGTARHIFRIPIPNKAERQYSAAFIPLEIIPSPRSTGRGLAHRDNSRRDLNTPRGFLTGFVRQPASRRLHLRQTLAAIIARLATVQEVFTRSSRLRWGVARDSAFPQSIPVAVGEQSGEWARGLGPQLVYVALVGLVILLPVRFANEVSRLQAVRAEVINTAAAGLASFAAGSQAAIEYDFFKASGDFEEAVNRFREAENALAAVPATIKILANALPSGQQLASGKRLLEAGAALARVGQTVSSDFVFLKHDGETPSGGSAGDLFTRLSQTAATIEPDLEKAEKALAEVRSEDLPPEYRAAFGQIRLLVPVVRSAVAQLLTLNQLTSDLLGIEEPRRYLVMFQNNNELRASGGFMGTFAVMELADGRVRSLNIAGGGTYDLQGSLTQRLLAPEPLQLINPRWEFQDANWWVDWPTSAKKVAWFYRQAGGESVDGVVAVDLSFIESLLDITGPILVPSYNLTVTAQNFAAEAQAEVELRYDRATNRPKQFIADLAPILINRLETDLDNNAWLVAEAVSRALTEKHFLVYRERADIEARLVDLGWGGALNFLPRFADSLGVVHTNIAGGKTDGVISDVVSHEVSSQADGSLIDTLTIERTHRGNKGEVFTGVRNVDYLRVYVPLGSRLLMAEGFSAPDQSLWQVPPADLEMDDDLAATAQGIRHDPTTGVTIYNEFGRTVFAHWLMVDPGESATVRLRYQLPWRIEETSGYGWQPWSSYFGWTEDTRAYRFLWEKQPGTGSTVLRHSFKSAKPLRFKESSRPVIANDYGWRWEESLKADASLAVTFALE